MNPERVNTAVEAVRRAFADMPEVPCAVLFGSAATGTAGEESDVDLLVECAPRARAGVRQVLAEIERVFETPITAVFHEREDLARMDKQFLESVLRHGRALKGSLPILTPHDIDLEPLRLVTFQTTGLSPRLRARFLRELDGYRTRKRVGRRQYRAERKGFLQKVGGWRVGRGAIVVPEGTAAELDVLFSRYRVRRIAVPIWCQRP